MFQFGSTISLWGFALLPLAGALFWHAKRGRRRALDRFGDDFLVSSLAGSVNHRARRFKNGLVMLALAFGVVGLARPQFGTRLETVQREGMDIVVALDLSTSMLAEDVQPSRLQRARLDILRIIESLDGDRIGLISFAGQAFVQSPLTTDYAAARMFLNAMDIESMPVQGTDLGAALKLAIDGFPDAPADARVVVLVTDGEDHEGSLEAQVERAVDLGVTIYPLGIGSAEGAPIPVGGGAGRFKRDEEGTVITTRIDGSTLERIAAATEGRFFRTTPESSEVDFLLGEIDALGGREIEAREVTRFEEQFQIFLVPALLLLLLESMWGDRARVSRTWRGRFA